MPDYELEPGHGLVFCRNQRHPNGLPFRWKPEHRRAVSGPAREEPQMDVMWTNSGDSHFLEPSDLYRNNLSADLVDRLPRSERINDDEEIVHIDGRQIRRRLPKPKGEMAERLKAFREAQQANASGGATVESRLEHLDEQGVWAEVVFPSLGLWYNEISSVDLVTAAARVLNDYVADDLIRRSPRFVPTATLPLQSVEASVQEIQRCAELGFHAVFLPTGQPNDMPYWNDPSWDPLWDACANTGMVVAYHIGTDSGPGARAYRGRGGAIMNFVHTTFGGQAAVVALVAAGVLERHPDLKVLVSEGGATWAPFLGDRMNELVRQQPMWDDGTLSMLPKEYVMRQVYASFQHDETAIPALTAMGYRNVMFGTDYPHTEGTFPHTQKVLHELFDDVDAETSHRIRIGAFAELFPHTGTPPQAP
jgi:predicted TIM-barrel fold metal-dependent hydrolase